MELGDQMFRKVSGAINDSPDLMFVFPECHQKQHVLVAGFATKLSAEFQCCVGAVDGILILDTLSFRKGCSLDQLWTAALPLWQKEKVWLELSSYLRQSWLLPGHFGQMSRINI
jgi:hypothetical protein